MVNLLVVNPTDNSLPVGDSLNCPISLGVIAPFNPTIGSGSLTCFTSSSASANGNYSISVIVSGSGTFNVFVNQLASGNWHVNIGQTGTLAQYSTSFTATGAQVGNSVVFTNIENSQQVVTLAQDNGGFLTKGKVEIKLSTAPVTLYIQNAG